MNTCDLTSFLTCFIKVFLKFVKVDQLNRMGSVRHRLSEFRQDCNVVLVGDVRVGKSALVNRFINNKFSEVSFVLFFCLKIY